MATFCGIRTKSGRPRMGYCVLYLILADRKIRAISRSSEVPRDFTRDIVKLINSRERGLLFGRFARLFTGLLERDIADYLI